MIDKMHRDCESGNCPSCEFEHQEAVKAGLVAAAQVLLALIDAHTPPPPVPIHYDDLAVDRFAAAMKSKLEHARKVKGKSGWETSECEDDFLAFELIDHLTKANKGTFEDIANYAMMLHQRGTSPHTLVATFHTYLANGEFPPAPPVQEAAQVLASKTPNPVFDILKPILMGEHSVQIPEFDEHGDEHTRSINVPWVVQKEIIAGALRALAEQGEA